jgi:transglutaminase-like putative cysteine protease
MLTIIRKKHISIEDIRTSMQYLLEKSSQDENIRALTTNIVALNTEKIPAVFDWVKKNIKYTPDPVDANGQTIELFISPSRMVNNFNQGQSLSGDCDDMALTLTAMYRSIGTPANVVILDTKGQGYDHAVCTVNTEKMNWIYADPTGNAPLGWEISFFQKYIIY